MELKPKSSQINSHSSNNKHVLLYAKYYARKCQSMQRDINHSCLSANRDFPSLAVDKKKVCMEKIKWP